MTYTCTERPLASIKLSTIRHICNHFYKFILKENLTYVNVRTEHLRNLLRDELLGLRRQPLKPMNSEASGGLPDVWTDRLPTRHASPCHLENLNRCFHLAIRFPPCLFAIRRQNYDRPPLSNKHNMSLYFYTSFLVVVVLFFKRQHMKLLVILEEYWPRRRHNRDQALHRPAHPTSDDDDRWCESRCRRLQKTPIIAEGTVSWEKSDAIALFDPSTTDHMPNDPLLE